MTKPLHIILIQSKRPRDLTPEERKQLVAWHKERADLFAKIRERVARGGQ